jgi:tyrosyl-DNA phosphodiesterase 2
MLIGFAEPRMSAALHHLSTIISDTASNLPVVIFLQEMTTSDLKQITETPWIQSKFYITEPDSQTWRSSLYGTTTLVDRRLRVGNVFRVPWVSKFERDGLFVNLSLSSGLNEFDKVLRLCNTHLESLVADPPVRPLQLQAAAPYLHGEQVYAAILAGDLNAIQPFDRTLHSDNNFKDAYLELGGQEDSDEGYTWGYQVPQALRERFGCSRMDKILFSGKVEAKNIMRIGMGVKVEGEQGGEMRDGGEDGWVTDHYGVMGDFELTGSLNLRSGDESDDGLRSKLA